MGTFIQVLAGDFPKGKFLFDNEKITFQSTLFSVAFVYFSDIERYEISDLNVIEIYFLDGKKLMAEKNDQLLKVINAALFEQPSDLSERKEQWKQKQSLSTKKNTKLNIVKIIKWGFLALIILSLLFTCSLSEEDNSNSIEKQERAKEREREREKQRQEKEKEKIKKQQESNRALVEMEVREWVKSNLKDPSSAQFRNQVEFCGEVNAKNAFGGYTGFKKFIAIATKEKQVVFEDTFDDPNIFVELWNGVCVKK
ncbi:MAG: hypothetical protein J6W29_10330 [Neisseriaceae bacterium]|nr:hypothetical protein [Neisseriaceae bacterium]